MMESKQQNLEGRVFRCTREYIYTSYILYSKYILIGYRDPLRYLLYKPHVKKNEKENTCVKKKKVGKKNIP